MTIGTRESLNGTIQLSPYDAAWAGQFAQLAGRIRVALGSKALLLEHVGSTSVPGTSAKPVIDMTLAVADTTDESDYVPPLEQQGFVLRLRERAWFEHRLFESSDVAANLHVFTIGSEEIERMLLLRDWLRTHEDDRRFYEDTKRELAARTWPHVQHYADAKSAVVKQILARAADWRRPV